MVRVSGHLAWSVDGLGVGSPATGTVQVDKPAGATVLAAYYMAAQTNVVAGAPSGISLGGSDVTFSHGVTDDTGFYGFNNVFAEVTDIVAPLVDAAPAGIVDVAVDEGQTLTEGTALVVIFDDPTVDYASVVLEFGRSAPDGDQFSLEFPALTQPQVDDLRMSIGVSYSYQPGQDSTITVDGTTLADEAGNYEDCATFPNCGNGALFTVGGVGDNLDNPTVPAPSQFDANNDDELYSLAPFVSVGDSSINVSTLNPSHDDNLFFAGFYLNHVALDGAIAVGDAAEEPITEVTTQSVNSGSLVSVQQAVRPAAELADTGVSSTAPLLAAAVLGAAGLALLALSHRRRRPARTSRH
jgi:hypothetical protein